MKVEEMLKIKGDHVYKIKENDSVMDAVKAMNEKEIGAMIVVNNQQEIVGIVTERDILHHFAEVKHPRDVYVKTIMTPSEKLLIAKRDDNTTTLMGLMTSNKIRHLPVIDRDKVIGVISIGDVIKAMHEESERESRLLRDYVKNPYGVPVV